jgi:hypothetical protein
MSDRSKFFNSFDLDCNSKQWRLFADVANDVATVMFLLSGAYPWMYTPILCVGSVVRALVGVAGSSTRVAVIQHQVLLQIYPVLLLTEEFDQKCVTAVLSRFLLHF